MSLLDLLNQDGGDGLGRLARQFGLDGEQAEKLAGVLAPAVGGAAKRRAAEGDMDRVLSPMKGERQAGWFEKPEEAASPAAQADGAAFLGTLFGRDDAASELSREAAGRTGIDAGTVGQFLPALAAMLQGGMQRQAPDDEIEGALGMLGGGSDRGASQESGGLGGLLGGLMGGSGGGSASSGGGLGGLLGGLMGGGDKPAAKPGGGLGALAQMLDTDGDGDVMDDILGKLMR